ncbi:MAG: hypothetical protein QM783_17670 [Phycisphaerales bacterium]
MPADVLPPWEERLEAIVSLMRDMSLLSDPQEIARMYSKRVRAVFPNDGVISISRRSLDAPFYKVTRATAWELPGGAGQPDPWREPHRLPVHSSGLLGELLYGDKPVLIPDLRVAEDDPCRALFLNARSAAAIPQYEGGKALNMVVVLNNRPGAMDPERFPELVQQSNLFGARQAIWCSRARRKRRTKRSTAS